MSDWNEKIVRERLDRLEREVRELKQRIDELDSRTALQRRYTV